MDYFRLFPHQESARTPGQVLSCPKPSGCLSAWVQAYVPHPPADRTARATRRYTQRPPRGTARVVQGKEGVCLCSWPSCPAIWGKARVHARTQAGHGESCQFGVSVLMIAARVSRAAIARKTGSRISRFCRNRVQCSGLVMCRSKKRSAWLTSSLRASSFAHRETASLRVETASRTSR